MMALSSALEPLRSVNRASGENRYVWSVLGQVAGPVAASNGLEIQTAHGISDAPPADLTIVVASLGVERFHDRRLFSWLRDLRNRHRLIGAISNGTLVLAQAGLLRGRRATIHWEMQPFMAESFPEIEIVDTLYCWEADIMTCAGGTAAMDMMLELIAAREGRAMAVTVAEQFLHGPTRPSDAVQRQAVSWRYGVTDKRTETAIRVMEQQIAAPLKISRVASLAGVSERQLERLFHETFGQSPSRFYMVLRLQAARARLLGSTDSMEIIAEATGFSSQAHFSNAIKAWTGMSPLAIRKRQLAASVGNLQTGGGIP